MTRRSEHLIPYRGPDTPEVRRRRYWADDMHLWGPGFMFSAVGALLVLGGIAIELGREGAIGRVLALYGAPFLVCGILLIWAWRRRRLRGLKMSG